MSSVDFNVDQNGAGSPGPVESVESPVEENEFQPAAPEAPMENETDHPEPPFTDADDERVQTTGITCYYSRCNTGRNVPVYYSYASLLKHVRNFHSCPTEHLKGTHLHIQGVKELNAYQKLKRQEAKENQKNKESLETAVVASESTIAPENEQKFTWVVMPCFVKCNSQGQVLQPFQSCGIALPGHTTPQGYEGPPIKKVALPQKKSTKNKYLVDTADTSLPQEEKKQLDLYDQRFKQWWTKSTPGNPASSASGGVIAVETVPKDNPNNSGVDGVIAGDEEGFASSDGNVASYRMISDIHAFVEKQNEKQNDQMQWKKFLPTVTIKAAYMDPSKAPTAKGEGAYKADFPKKFKSDFVDIPHFKTYLNELRNKQNDNLDYMFKAVGRFLGFLDITPSDKKPDVKIDSPETLVAFFTSGVHLQMLKSPMMSPKYSWPALIVSGLELYVDYQLRNLAILHTAGDMENFECFFFFVFLRIDMHSAP